MVEGIDSSSPKCRPDTKYNGCSRLSNIPRVIFECIYTFKPIQLFISGFPGGSVVKNPPAKQKMWVQSLGQEDLLEKEMATHFSILA